MSEANSSHSPLFLCGEHGKRQFNKLENSCKVNESSYNDIFLAVVIRRKMKLILGKKNWGVSGTLSVE